MLATKCVIGDDQLNLSKTGGCSGFNIVRPVPIEDPYRRLAEGRGSEVTWSMSK